MARKKHEEEHENHERWLVSYADFITLLFAFFVVMYSVSRVDNKKMAQAAASMKWALHYSGTGGVARLPLFEGPPSEGGQLVDAAGAGSSVTPQALAETIRSRLENRLRQFVMQRPGPTTISVAVEGKSLTVRLAAAELFESGQAALRPDVLPILDAIADEVAPLQRPLRLEGHTDDAPVTGGRYHDNWELSAARAATVVSYLERAHGVRPQLMSAVGYGSSKPLASGSSPEARETNRRLEVVVDLGAMESPRRSEAPRMEPRVR